MSNSSAGGQKRPAGRKDRGARDDYKGWADVKRRVNEYTREKQARESVRPSTLVVTRIVKTPLTNDANATQQTPQNDV